ncbi:MAG TPA: hypothetical protein VFH80_06035 [Solirubrobacteraceae bacterium]|nr:hypothetical protein [Solirubrobacteraceae bacterium]
MSQSSLTVRGMTIDDLLAFHRATFGDAVMEAGGDGGGDGGDGGAGTGTTGGEQTFTQADVDRIVRERVQRERAKFADYDEIKAKAEGARTLEQRIADLEVKGSASEQRALRAEIAGEFGISTKRGDKGEPSDAELFLTGTDEATLRSQAQRLADRESERKKNGNHVPREGNNPQPGPDTVRDFTRNLFKPGE